MPNGQASQQDFKVLVDGVTAGSFTPSGTSYQSFTTSVFTVAAGAHTITFQGLDSAGGDNTAFIDRVAATTRFPDSDPGFEQVSVGAGKFQYRPTSSPWSFSGNAGISGNNSGFTSGNPAAPEGAQVALLQGTGSFSQSTTNWAAGSYSISFYAAQRANHQASRQDLSVLVDGTVVGGATPSDSSYQSFTTAVFTVTAGCAHDHVPGPGQCRRRQHRLHRLGCRPTGQHAGVNRRPGLRAGLGGCGQVPVPPDQLAMELLRQCRHQRQQQRLHLGQPRGPRRAQVAFLQGTGSFSQTVTNWAAGSYVNQLLRRPAQQPGARSRTSRCWSTAPRWAASPPPASHSRASRPLCSPLPPVRTRSRSRAWIAAGGDNTAFIDLVAAVAQVSILPTVTSVTPAPDAGNVDSSTVLTATFNESMQASSITTSTFLLEDSEDTLTATVSYSDINHTATLTPSAPLAASTTYTATISGVMDPAGNVMTSPFIWSFTTAATAPTPVLVAAYSFDEGTGGTLDDLSGNGNNGSISNATWSTQGKFGARCCSTEPVPW